jgi:hypothetical protein
LWAQDEARLGLVPIIRRIWALKGQRPIAVQRRAYEWFYLNGFVHPASGKLFWLTMPTVSTEIFSIALAAFAREVGAGAKRHILLVVDGAGWHTSQKLTIPEGIHLCHLPPYSPELQPAEHLWPLVHERIANKPWFKLSTLETATLERCMALAEAPQTVHQHTHFHWWKDLDEHAT